MEVIASDETADIGDGLKVPTRLDISEPYRRGWTVGLLASYRGDSGAYEVDQVTVTRDKDLAQKFGHDDGPEITGELLRMVTVAKLLRQGVIQAVLWANPEPSAPPVDARADGPTSEVLWWVARLYRIALLCGDPPTQAVAEGLAVPRSTAARWVTRARDRGLLTVSDPRGGRRV